MIIQKYLAQQGICSRREAERLLKAGLLKVNGRPAVPGADILPTDIVTIDPAGEKQLAGQTTVAIYKPRGVMCSRSAHEGKNVFDLFPQYQHLNMVGRLDKESEGLLLLSNNGLLTKKITGDQHEMEKEYEITTAEEVFAGKLVPIEKGMRLSDGPTLPAPTEIIDRHTFRVTLREGRNRQLRRMCGQLNLTVTSLKRIRIGSLLLGKMKPGSAKVLTSEQIKALLTFS
jgi:23S rRNA pseudouridine2604 synthase